MKKLTIITALLMLSIIATSQTKPDTVANAQFKEIKDNTFKPIYIEGNRWYILRTKPNGKIYKQYVTKTIVLMSTK